MNAQNRLVYIPNANYNGSDVFNYTISDGHGSSTTQTLSLTVNAINDNPVATISSAITNSNTPVIIDVLSGATDVDGDILSVDSYTQGSHGSVSLDAQNRLVYTPVANYYGADAFNYTIADGHGGSATQILNMTVNFVQQGIVGTAGNDTLNGTTGADTIYGLGGNDYINGNAGNDSIYGGSGNDTIVDNSGNDTYFFNMGDNCDTITDTNGTDKIQFGANIAQNNLVYIKSGNNLTIAVKDGNKIYEAANRITINNWYSGNKIESIVFNDGSTLSSSYIESQAKELKYGTESADSITDWTIGLIMDAKGGNDTIVGFNGNDIIYAGNGNDNITDYQGNDSIFGGAGNDTITDCLGNDTIIGGTGNDSIIEYQGNDTYLFNTGDNLDTITDSLGDDTISLGNLVNKNKVAFYANSTTFYLDYGNTVGADKVTVNNWNWSNGQIEKLQLNDGSYLTNADVSQVIQNMTAYASSHGIAMNSVTDVKNNSELMNIIAAAWHT